MVTGNPLVELVFGQAVGELGEDGATFVHKVINRQRAVEHPQGAVAELKSKNDRTTKNRRFYRAAFVVIKTLTDNSEADYITRRVFAPVVCLLI
jgi:hypothetical protein